MSDAPIHHYVGLPTARVLEGNSEGLGEGVFGNISQFPRATAARIDSARKNLAEIPDERIDRTVDPWRDRERRARSSNTCAAVGPRTR
jgi:hypothetical protein